MFQQVFAQLDNVFRTEPGCTTELDYTEQASWLLFLKYLDDLEEKRETEAGLAGKPYAPIVDAAHRWAAWASPKRADGTPDRDAALTGPGNAATLDYDITAGNTGLAGIWMFDVRGGQVSTSVNDTVNGGVGADTLAGGSGLDLFVFDAGQGNGDTVLDFNGSGAAAGDSLLFRGYGTAA